MFGYVIVNREELKFREFDEYRSYYCGLCRALASQYGKLGQIALNYDMTFVALLLSALYEPEGTEKDFTCALHPFHKQHMVKNDCLDYAADMTVLLTYYKALDDWQDDKKIIQGSYAHCLKKAFQRVSLRYPDKARCLAENLQKITEAEKAEIYDIDLLSGYFGDIMASLLAYQEDQWQHALQRMGFYLGKFIYLMDAYDDAEADALHGSYNPLTEMRKQADYEEKCADILTMMMAECSKEFELLPIIEHVEILRNILYSGVWIRYDAIQARRKKKKE